MSWICGNFQFVMLPWIHVLLSVLCISDLNKKIKPELTLQHLGALPLLFSLLLQNDSQYLLELKPRTHLCVYLAWRSFSNKLSFHCWITNHCHSLWHNFGNKHQSAIHCYEYVLILYFSKKTQNECFRIRRKWKSPLWPLSTLCIRECLQNQSINTSLDLLAKDKEYDNVEISHFHVTNFVRVVAKKGTIKIP